MHLDCDCQKSFSSLFLQVKNNNARADRNMARTPSSLQGRRHGQIEDSQIPGTVQLVDLDQRLGTRHARGHKDIILVPTPSANPEDPLNWSPGRKRLALAGVLAFVDSTYHESMDRQG